MDEAFEIFDYLPINKQLLEEGYISYLWNTFTVISECNSSAQPYAIMPFHLLFMLALQYKVMRIARAYAKHCDLAFALIGGREKDTLLGNSRSVFSLASINERTLPDLFKLVNLDKEVIKRIKEIVDHRNETLAHAKGSIESDPARKIQDYLEILRKLQKHMIRLNNKVAKKWLSEMEPGESGVEYIEWHLAEEYLCPADMQQGNLAKLEDGLNKAI